MIKVLFVCLGNICRSPTAHGVFEHLVKEKRLSSRFEIDSAGTAAWHVGKSPDSRSQKAAKTRGYELGHLRARQVCREDFEYYDYVLAMDNSNLADLMAECPSHLQSKLSLFLNFGDKPEKEVPDPYYGGQDGFDHVLDLVESASEGLLTHALAETQQSDEH